MATALFFIHSKSKICMLKLNIRGVYSSNPSQLKLNFKFSLFVIFDGIFDQFDEIFTKI